MISVPKYAFQLDIKIHYYFTKLYLWNNSYSSGAIVAGRWWDAKRLTTNRFRLLRLVENIIIVCKYNNIPRLVNLNRGHSNNIVLLYYYITYKCMCTRDDNAREGSRNPIVLLVMVSIFFLVHAALSSFVG